MRPTSSGLVEMTWHGYIYAPKAHSYSLQRTAELCISHRLAIKQFYAMGWSGISQKRLAVFISHGEQGFLKTAQCAVLPCEVSEGIRSPER